MEIEARKFTCGELLLLNKKKKKLIRVMENGGEVAPNQKEKLNR
jgi:hypothetical protein